MSMRAASSAWRRRPLLPHPEQVFEHGQEVRHLVFAPEAGSAIGGQGPDLTGALLSDAARLRDMHPDFHVREISKFRKVKILKFWFFGGLRCQLVARKITL
jgi:hypothetical protein